MPWGQREVCLELKRFLRVLPIAANGNRALSQRRKESILGTHAWEDER